MATVADAVTGVGRGSALSRVIYTESHDDVANDQVRVPESISPGDAGNWWAKKRATLGSALVLTSPGIPMLFQGQELLEDRWFDDTVALDWSKAGRFEGILRFHHDLIALRRGGEGLTRGLRGDGVEILRADDEAKLLVVHRWHDARARRRRRSSSRISPTGRGTTCVSGCRPAGGGASDSTAIRRPTRSTSAGTRCSIPRQPRSPPTASRSARWWASASTAWSSCRRTPRRGSRSGSEEQDRRHVAAMVGVGSVEPGSVPARPRPRVGCSG